MAIDKDKLMAAIDAKAENAYGADSDSAIAVHRSELIEAYLGLNTNPAPPGRSQVVDRSVFETIQTLLPSLVRIFAGSTDQVVKFVPTGPEDELGAEQTTAYVNYVATQKNPWDQIVSDWIHDALLLPNAYAMAYWDETKNVQRETYEGLTAEQLTVLVEDGAQVVEHSERPDEAGTKALMEQYAQQMQQYQLLAVQAMQQGQMPPPPPEQPQPLMLHDVVIEREDSQGKVKICVLPPEHCLVDEDTPSHTLDQCDYFEYRQAKTIADLRAMGLDVPEDIGDDMDIGAEPEDLARDRFDENSESGSDDSGIMRKVVARTIWIRCDADGKTSRLYYVIAVGRTVLHAEPVTRIPVASMCAQPLPHRHPGMSIAEVVVDIQDTKTAIKRGGLDNLYLTNNGRYAISDKVNLDDFLDSRPGGLVRLHDGAMPGEGHIMPLVHPFAFDQIIGSMEYFDQERQNRAGVSRYFSGTDAGAINKTASGTMALQNMAAQRVEHIARMLAPAFETIFSIVHELISKHQQKHDVIKLNGDWVNVDPTAWQTRRDVKISVGVGAGNKDSMLAQLSMQVQEQVGLLPTGIVKPENIYQTMLEKGKLQGQSNPEKFWTNPKDNPQQQGGPPPEVIVEQMRLEHDKAKTQAQIQAEQEKALLEGRTAQQEASLKLELEREKAAQEAALEKYKADLQAQTQLQMKQIEMGANVELKQAELETTRQLKGAELQNTRDITEFQASLPKEDDDDDDKKMMSQAMQMMAQAIEKMGKPKVIVRDESGRVAGVKSAE